MSDSWCYDAMQAIFKNPPAQAAALDLGSGTGWSTMLLREIGYATVDAVDARCTPGQTCQFSESLPGATFHHMTEFEA